MPTITIYPLQDPDGWRLRACADNEQLDHAVRSLARDETLVLHEGPGLPLPIAQLADKLKHGYPGIPVEVSKVCTCAHDAAQPHAPWCIVVRNPIQGSPQDRPVSEVESDLAKARAELAAAKEEIAVSDGAALDAIAEERSKFRQLAEAALGDAWQGLSHTDVVEMARQQRDALQAAQAALDAVAAEGEVSVPVDGS